MSGYFNPTYNDWDKSRMIMAQHLRWDHDWGIRRIGKRLGMSDKAVKEAVGEE